MIINFDIFFSSSSYFQNNYAKELSDELNVLLEVHIQMNFMKISTLLRRIKPG